MIPPEPQKKAAILAAVIRDPDKTQTWQIHICFPLTSGMAVSW